MSRAGCSGLRFKDSTSRRRGGAPCSSVATSQRLGENDAWLVATAESLDADIVGADCATFERLGARYLRFR